MQRMGFVEKVDIHTDRVVSDLSHLGLYAKASVELRIGDRIIYNESIDPATQTLIDDIYAEVYNVDDMATNIGGLTRICLANMLGNEMDCANLAGTDITYDHTTLTLSVVKTINVTSSYTAAYVRLYSATKLYFSTPISSTTVTSGDSISVTWQVTITATPSFSGVLSGADYNYRGLSGMILRAIGGKRRVYDYPQPKTARYVASDGFIVLLQTTLTRDPANRVASHPATNFKTSGNWLYLEIYNPANVLLLSYTLNRNIAPIPVTTSDSVRYTFAGRWS